MNILYSKKYYAIKNDNYYRIFNKADEFIQIYGINFLNY